MQDRQPEAPDFFIDYDSADVRWAEWIAYQLEGAHYRVFYREWDIRPGDHKVLKINDVLQSHTIRIILLLSPDYLQKNDGSVWATAFNERRLVPIQVRNYPVRGFLSAVEPINLVGLDEAEASIKLIGGITTERKRTPTPPNFPGSTYRQQGTKQPQRYPGILPPIWNVPPRNTVFTDRDPALTQLYEIFKEGQEGQVLTHVINGLGGMGKTQVAIEYAYRYNHRYDAILWIDASDEDSIAEHLVILLELLALQEQMTTNPKLAVKQWLQALSGNMRWLLILDNIADFALINDFIPAGGNGHVLMTVRTQTIGTVASSRYSLPEMSPEDGALLLLRRTGKFDPQVLLQNIPHADLVAAQELSRLMGNLPLMLDQAGAYIEGVDIALSDYLEYYNDSRLRPKLLEKRGEPTMHHPDPVATAWNNAFSKLNPDAYSLLLLCSFLYHEAIPEEVIIRGAATLQIFQTFAGNPLQRNEAFAELRKYSLLVREDQTKTFSMHRLVQVVLRDSLNEAEQRQWAERALVALYTGLHAAGQSPAPLSSHYCSRYFFHVQICLRAIKKWRIASDMSVLLLHLMGTHLYDYACNSHRGSTVEMDVAVIMKALEDYAAQLRAMNHLQQAEELHTFADHIRATCTPNV